MGRETTAAQYPISFVVGVAGGIVVVTAGGRVLYGELSQGAEGKVLTWSDLGWAPGCGPEDLGVLPAAVTTRRLDEIETKVAQLAAWDRAHVEARHAGEP